MSTRQVTQLENIRAYLSVGNSITPIEALNMFGSFRLAAIIHILRHEHELDIHTIFITENDKTFGKYVLAEFNKNGEHGKNEFY